MQKRQTYLVNPKFQLKFSLYICLLFLVASSFYPVIVYNLVAELIRAGGNPAYYEEKKQTLFFVLALWQVGFSALIFVIAIFISHRIAGPIYKLIMTFRSLRNNKAVEKIKFRNGDYFPELADEFNETFGKLSEKHHNDFVHIDEINNYLHKLSSSIPEDKKIYLNEIQKKLIEIQNRFNVI